MIRFRSWKEAHTAAVELARLLRHDVGIWHAPNPLDGDGYDIRSLPLPKNRFGHELTCEVVHPTDPL
jgi:hypothetical protein